MDSLETQYETLMQLYIELRLNSILPDNILEYIMNKIEYIAAQQDGTLH